MSKLSVIIPVYNTEKFIEKCLDSVLSQTYKNLEIIVVDDCSSGDIKEIVREYQKTDKRIKLISHDNNKGLFAARITGLSNASGDFFAFVDSDDYIGVDLYRVMMKKALEENADIVACDRREIYPDESLYAPHDMLEQKDWNLRNEEFLNLLLSGKGLDYGLWVVWNKIYSIRLWNECKVDLLKQTEHLIMCEDCAFSTAFSTACKHFVNIHHNFYYYNRNEESSTKQKVSYERYTKNLTDIVLAFDSAKFFLQKHKCYEESLLNWQSWKNSILSGWKNKINEDKSLTVLQSKKLLKLICENIIDEETDEHNLSRDFCCHGAFGGDFYEDIKQAISAESTKIVSFDCFDTLVQRPFFYPTDLFSLMDIYINEFISTTDFIVFKDIRIRAEQIARERKVSKNLNFEDVTLDEIYDVLIDLCPHLSENLEKIKKLECELEIKYCLTRQSGKELFECALALGKKVVITTDMYLPIDVIKSILKKNDYPEVDIYLSNEIGKTKATGSLYRHIIKKEQTNDIVHIGDNWTSDVENAQKCGLISFHLPKSIDMLQGTDSIFSGQSFNPIFKFQRGNISCHESFYTLGIRCMAAVAANKIFDNPFVVFDRESDFNADPTFIGYFLLGMHNFAVAHWLIDSVQKEKYENMNFMARDGYLARESFNTLSSIFDISCKSNYIYLSRKAILPLMLEKKFDFYALYNNFFLWSLTPRKFLENLKRVLKDDSIENNFELCKKNNIDLDLPFDSIEKYMNFGKFFLENLYSDEKAQKYKENFYAYFKNMFSGKSATFDVGYSARCESTLSKNFGFDITAHYIHTNNDRYFGRAEKSGIQIKRLYKNSPFITGMMREIFMSEQIPSCIGYKGDGENFHPEFEEFDSNLQTVYVVKTIQEASLQFVTDMVQIFSTDIKRLAYSFNDACIPFEYFLHSPKYADLRLFKGIYFEDDMGIGNHKDFVDFWLEQIGRWGSEKSKLSNVSQMPELAHKLYDKISKIFPKNSKRRTLMKKVIKFLFVKK